MRKARILCPKTVILLVAILALALLASCCPQERVKPVVEQPPPPPPPPPPPVVEKPTPPPPPPPTPVVTRLRSINFDFNKSDLTPAAQDSLNYNIQQFRAKPDAMIRIEGNCDERGSVDYNLALGEKRANAAKAYLISLGIPEDRIQVVSNGKESPIDSGHDEAAWAKNRRVDFSLVSQ